jgi:hypothetical protein
LAGRAPPRHRDFKKTKEIHQDPRTCASVSSDNSVGNFWRPITAIRLGDTDGNPDTEGVPDWTPLQPTYPMPDHDSGHAVQGGVAAEVLKQFFGTDDISFTACSSTVGANSTCADPAPVIRSYSSFSQAADENAVSRIYIGIHFRRAVEEGVRHGRTIGAYAVHKFMKPAH